jgi:UDP-N-acetylmuramoylalanine--D-glutamate ligase
MDFLTNVSVLVLGLGESGLACAQFAHRHGAQVRVADTRLNAPNVAAVQALDGVNVVLGPFNEAMLQGVTQLVVSPGLSPHQADVATLLAAAQQRGIKVCSEIDWFMACLAFLKTKQGYDPKVIAVTGTNGKTTVTELATHLCNEAGVPAIACGNISPAALTALMASMEQSQLPQVWVLELSSFQLHYTQSFEPHAAALLNVSQDHLDWHVSMDEYVADKGRIFGENTLRILNRDDSALRLFDNDNMHTFGLTAPLRAGDVGCNDDSGLNWMVQACVTELERKRRKIDPIEVHLQRLMPADALRIRGSHNHANALAALLLAQAAGVPIAKGLHGLRTYVGAANRCELLQVIQDVEYINDSKGTNVGATVAALTGLGEGRKRLVLIAGGVGKGQDFSPLKAPVSSHCKAVMLIGESTQVIADALEGVNCPVLRCDDLQQAVQQAAEYAELGDAVLLSPACASFDQFKSYAHRAEVFIALVHSLASDRGQA